MTLSSITVTHCRPTRHWLLQFAFLFAIQGTLAQAQQWLQWGGPDRNFKAESKGLATSWPSSGPRQIWSRDLGEGHSSIIVDGNRLYTMYRPAGLFSKIKRSQEQLVVFGGDVIAGLDPNNGELLWNHTHKTEWGLNISTPVWGNDNLLFISSAYNNGSRLLQLAKTGDKTTVKELWFTNKMRVHIGTVIRVDDYVYGSSGDFGPAFITALDLKTGKVAWQERGFARATFLYAEGKFILLAEDGTLALATMTPTGISVHAKAEVMNSTAWTVPTLVGTRLYLRDRETMMALELGGQ
jgi:hypothetical protein